MTQETKKMIASLVAVLMITGGIIYKDRIREKDSKINESLNTVTEFYKNDTEIDEAIDMNLANYGDMSIIEAADYLEESIDIVEMLNCYDFSEVKDLDKLTDEEYLFAESLSKEDIILLTTVLDVKEDNKSLEFEEAKIKSIKMLDHIKENREEWIEDNGKDVILNSLAWVIKGSVAEELGLEPDEILDIQIPPAKKLQDMDFYLVYNDEKYYASASAGLYNALYYRYQVKSMNGLESEKYRVYKEALNSSKILAMTGVDTKKNKFVNVRTLKDAKNLINNQ